MSPVLLFFSKSAAVIVLTPLLPAVTLPRKLPCPVPGRRLQSDFLLLFPKAYVCIHNAYMYSIYAIT